MMKTASACTALGLGGCAARSAGIAGERNDSPPPPGLVTEPVRELVRYATLAPSSHNTQCWKFRVDSDGLDILPDFDRRCPVVDPDDHHLFVSLGCATENLLIAGSALGIRGVAAAGPDDGVSVGLLKAQPAASPLFDALCFRQTTRANYDGRPLSAAECRLLEQAGRRQEVEVILLSDRREMETALEYIVEGNTAQVNNPAFVRELKSWIRFGAQEAARTGDGLFSRCTGNPAAPRWLGGMLFDRFFTAEAENAKIVRHVRSSAGIAVFVSNTDDRRGWIEVGRAFERFALQATAMGIRTAHLNQPVEERELRFQFSRFLGIGERRADLVIRFGRGPVMPRSYRRPVEEVLV